MPSTKNPKRKAKDSYIGAKARQGSASPFTTTAKRSTKRNARSQTKNIKKNELVSIVIPVYNVEKYLQECFVSVSSQTYQNIEIILVDDGSTDNSGRIADSLAKIDKRTVVVHKKNGGLSDARNAGIRIAQGRYVTFIDSDDYIDRYFVEKLVTLARTNKSDIVQCDNSRNPNKLGVGSGKTLSLSGAGAFVELIKFKTVAPTAWGKLYELKLFKGNQIEFPVGRIHEDTAILYKLIYKARKITCLSKVLYFYRKNNDSIMTSSYTAKHYGSVIRYNIELEEFIKENKINVSSRTLSRHRALRFLSVLQRLALRGKENTATYLDFRKRYVRAARKAHSVICVVGALPVYFPKFFRIARSAQPALRKMLGKI